MQSLQDRLIRFLRWSEKYTKTDMVYLAHGGFWLTLSQVGIGLIALAVSMMFARFVPKDVYGTYRFLLSLFWILTALSLTGLPSAVARAVARGEDGAYRQSFKLSFLGSAPMALVAAGIAIYYALQANYSLAIGAVIIAVIGPLFQMGYSFGAFLEGKKDFKRTALAGIVLNIVPALSLLGAIPFVKNPLVFFFIYLAANALTALALCLWAYLVYKPDDTPSEGLLNLSWHFSAMNILATLAEQMDQLVTFHYLGASALALYSFATSLPDQIKSLFGTVANMAFPKFAHRPVAEIQATLWFRLLRFTALIVAVVVLYILAAPLIFHLLFPTYTNAVFYSQLYALALIPIANIIPATVLQAHAAKRELYIMNTTFPIFQIAALFVGVIYWGLIGVILARIAARTFNFFLGLLLLKIYSTRIAA